MAEVLEGFLHEQKAKIQGEKATLGQDPPYMEIRASTDDVYRASVKENIPPSKKASAQAAPGKEESFGLSLPLGEDYERKKQRLQQELRMDYRRYMAEEISRQKNKKKELCAGEPGQHLGLSLPIGEKRSAKDRLRIERNKEYNNFLKGQSEKANTVRDTTKALQVREAAGHTSEPNPRLSVKRDAATLTESRAGRVSRGRSRRQEERRHRQPKLVYDSELEYSEEDEEEQEEQELRMRRPRYRDAVRQRDGVEDKEHYPEAGHYSQRHRTENRVPQGRRKLQPTDVSDEENREELRKTLSATPKHMPQTPVLTGSSERSRSAVGNKVQFATGLIIGAPEGDSARQQRKARYRQELLEQIAEQQRNKRREKELELKVAATGAIDPEKQPDRIKQFGAMIHGQAQKRDAMNGVEGAGSGQPSHRKLLAETEERTPPERPRVAFQSPLLGALASTGPRSGAGAGLAVPAGIFSPVNEEFHRSLSSNLGEMVAPRVPGAPPPLPPALAEVYRTPSDEAYYYYGARNPLDPRLAYSGMSVSGGGAHPVHYFATEPPQAGQPVRPEAQTHRAANQGGPVPTGMGIGAFPGERSRQSKESVLRYQEALRQQNLKLETIQEREERRRREAEERERYEAKLEADMKAYDPWGKGGGGAPLRDDQGNLIADLKRMHRVNEDAYVNPIYRDKGRSDPGDRNVRTSQEQNVPPLGPSVSGSSGAYTSPFARGNVFPESRTPRQLQEQNKYKDYLKQQIEEKQRKEAEERERQRLEEEKEEARLAEQRVQIQKEYEEEQEKRRRKEMEQMAKNKELMQQAEERSREADRKKRAREERASVALREQQDKERRGRQEEVRRAPSPPIPTVQNRMAARSEPRPHSLDSRRSASVQSESSLPVPQSPPVPAQRNQLRAKEQHGSVVGELSALRRQLRSRQRRLQDRLQSDREEAETPPSLRYKGVFDMARLRLQAPVRRAVNPQNIHDFNQLKYRESESREQVQHVYPDPPSDDQSLEIQQQALLREQQRRISRMRRRGTVDFYMSPVPQPSIRLKERSAGAAPIGSLLESDSKFFEPNASTPPTPHQHGRRPRTSSANHGRLGGDVYLGDVRTSPQQDPGPPSEPTEQLDSHSLDSLTVEQLRERNQLRMRRLEELGQRGWTDGPDSPAEERASPQTPEGRLSVETVATEPWLRPGSTEGARTQRERVYGRGAPSPHPSWDGPSTYHG